MYYDLGAVLGKGQFGITRTAKDRKMGVAYACKTIMKTKLPTEEDKEDAKREVQILWHLKGHPNVVSVVGSFEDAKAIHIVMDVCKGGELFDKIIERGHYTEKDAAAMCRTMLRVIHHMHTLGVMHRDLKPENFLLSDNSRNATVKATDFGLSVFARPDERFEDLVGSAFYVAPEVLQCDYSREADIWSCGVILYILLSGVPPFWDDTEQGIFAAIVKGDIDFQSKPWPSISSGAKECVKMMLTKDTAVRATAEQVMNHPWMKEDGSAPDTPLDNAVVERIKKFSEMNKLKKLALKMIAANLSGDQIQGLKELFESMDADGNGTITVQAMREGLQKQRAHIAEGEIEALMNTMDMDENGTIDYMEFIAATLNASQVEREQNMMKAFQTFDKDDSGFISIDEIKEAATEWGMDGSDMEKFLKEADLNGDGEIDYLEFVQLMKNSTPLKKKGTLNFKA